MVDADGEERALIPPGVASNWVKSGQIARVAKTAAELSRGPRGVVRRAHQKHTLRAAVEASHEVLRGGRGESEGCVIPKEDMADLEALLRSVHDAPGGVFQGTAVRRALRNLPAGKSGGGLLFKGGTLVAFCTIR